MTAGKQEKMWTWRRVLLVLALGPLPVAIIAAWHPFGGADEDRYGPILTSTLASLWGLTVGVMRKSLLKAMIGLNFGAVCGFAWFKVINHLRDTAPAILATILAGAVLGAALSLNFKNPAKSLMSGAGAGAVSFAAMGIAAWLVTLVFRPTLIGWTVMCLVPFGSGIALFLWLVGRPEIVKSTASGASISKETTTD